MLTYLKKNLFFACALMLLAGWSQVVAQDVDLDQLIEKITETEKLFSGDLDVQYTCEYIRKERIGEPKNRPASPFRAYRYFTDKVHFVSQGEMFFSSTTKEHLYTDTFETIDNEPLVPELSKYFTQYNGKEITSVASSTLGVFAYLTDRDTTNHLHQSFPYKLAIPNSTFSSGKLSVAMQGYDKAKSDPALSKRLYNPYTIEIEELKSAEFPNHTRLTFQFHQSTTIEQHRLEDLGHREVFILNNAKNFLTERHEMYDPKFGSTTTPASAGTVLKWSQTTSGVWYPQQSLIQFFSTIQNGTKRIKKNWDRQYEYTIDDFSFSPEYDDVFFNQVQIPVDARVFKNGVELADMQ
ncbi:hypothetical protein Pla110_09080 [Polystyrenella longa]|uniref:Outer membrane lipoprotein-sorting protein n=1 Tax=Polystyrenella longa TaxID=2528007 RepID=A0A518CIZ8_9PLAN|nr:hypothetical protein [Polystyrenella longa]QDU79203.1 hypothetical protein Pla110_09080 [Polystyrenella longa]